MSFNVQYFIEHFAYFGIVIALIGGMIGLPIPDEFLLTYVGYTVYQGNLLLIPALLVAILGAMGGISLSFLLGHKLGLPFLKKFGPKFNITEKRLHVSGKLFSKLGSYLLVICFFIPGVRHIIAYLAAIHGYSYKKFFFYALSGAIAWATTFISLGHLFANQIKLVEDCFIKYSMIAVPLLCGILLCVIVAYLIRRKWSLNQNM
ncbi:DedA family protein [Bacillus testis]|uniref:DedA family protein n=1 Tax=Bacillus testis TaxID=1622072 RepID=UPI00067EF34F|nr:DedA family protein [Bacillus testis]